MHAKLRCERSAEGDYAEDLYENREISETSMLQHYVLKNVGKKEKNKEQIMRN